MATQRVFKKKESRLFSRISMVLKRGDRVKRRGFFKHVMLLSLFTVFCYSYWKMSWKASLLPSLADWKSHLVFTPRSIIASKDIYEVDMFLYAFKVAPLITSLCFLSLFAIILILIQFVKKQLVHVSESKVTSS